MRQMTLAQQTAFQRYSKKTRREQFWKMEAVMPWAELLAQIEPQFERRDGTQAGGSLDYTAGLFSAAVVCAFGHGGWALMRCRTWPSASRMPWSSASGRGGQPGI